MKNPGLFQRTFSISAVECSLCFSVATLPVEMTYHMFTLLGFNWSNQTFISCILYKASYNIQILSVSVEKLLVTLCNENIGPQEKVNTNHLNVKVVCDPLHQIRH